jgi:hypothetical protein
MALCQGSLLNIIYGLYCGVREDGHSGEILLI